MAAKKNYQKKIVIGRKPDGSLLRKTFNSSKSKKDAQKKADAWLVESKARQLCGIDNIQEASFESWARHWLKVYKHGKVKENTYSETYERTVEKILIPYFSITPLQSIKLSDIEKFYNIQATHYAESTLHKMKLCLNGIFETAIENNYCQSNPAKRAKYTAKIKSKEKRAYTQKEYDTIISYAKKHLKDLPDGLLIWIEAECGLRPEELFGLDYSDFDLENDTVHIHRAVVSIRNVTTIGDVKNKRSNRVLPISTELSQALKSCPKTGLITGSLLDSSKWSDRRYLKWFENLCREHPEIEIYTPHELRHTRGSLLYKATGDIYAVSRFLGHSSVKVTEQIYVHVNVEDLRKQLNI